MPKYLIQDIIPPDRKRRKTAASIAKDHHASDVHRENAPKTVHHDYKNDRGGAQMHQSRITKHAFADENGDAREHAENLRNNAVLSDHTTSENEEHKEADNEVTYADSAENAPREHARLSSLGPQGAETAPHSWQKNKHMPLFEPSYVPHGITNEEGGWKKWIWWIVSAAGVAVAAFFISIYFSGTTVTILPKKDKIPMDQKFTAAKLPADDTLPYAIVTIAESETREVPATGTKTVSSKASGQIVIYNEQTVPQRLIKNTRFESPKGYIYRINDSVSIPKATTQGGKLVPGSLTVTIYADEPGPAYNSDPVDFTVPGLKNGPLYKKVYARSKGPITGGASGTAKVVRDADLKTAEEDLRVAIETKLRNRARAEISVHQVAPDGGFVIEIGKAALATKPPEDAEHAVVEMSGRLVMVVFDREKLTQVIARALLPTWKGEPIEITNLETIVMNVDRVDIETLEKGDKIEFTLKGTPEFRWIIDQESIKKTLSGMPKSRFDPLMRAYPTIERATAKLHPSWKRSFPDDPEKIVVVFDDATRAP